MITADPKLLRKGLSSFRDDFNVISGLCKVLSTEETPKFKRMNGEPYYLYADAKPSESIQLHELPGLAVACLCPVKEGVNVLAVPVKQFKAYRPRQRERRASELSSWLATERSEGLKISGCVVARTQTAAARFGLDLIEELPDTRVEKHHGSFRLYFGGEPIDFPHAVALIYYSFAVNFAILPTAKDAPDGRKRLVVYMDRFQGPSAGVVQPGQHAPTTPGMKFIRFARERSQTWIEIDEANKERGIEYDTKTLDWWRSSSQGNWEPGKEHPHFALTDWFVASALAHGFEQEFINYLPNKKTARATTRELLALYAEFRKFNIWSFEEDEVLNHLVSEEKQWEVSAEARQFIMNRAESI